VLLLDSDPSAAARLLDRAIELDAYDSESHIGRGLLAESAGRLEEAEQYLRRAAALSRRFRPHWALAFFYARHSRTDLFWKAASVAANIEAADPQPVYRIAHQLSGDPGIVPDELNLETQHALASYAAFLLQEQGPTALGRTALRVDPTTEHRELLLAVTDRLIEQDRVDEAVQIWNRLHGSRVLDPGAGLSLTNQHFESRDARGFGWRQIPNLGIELHPRAGGGVDLEFSGREPESAALLEQVAPVLADRNYRFVFDCSGSNGNGPSGLAWEIAPTGERLSFEGPRMLTFHTPAGKRTVRIALKYARPLGVMRLEGTVTLHSAELRLL
jgi:hypothetical protein